MKKRYKIPLFLGGLLLLLIAACADGAHQAIPCWCRLIDRYAGIAPLKVDFTTVFCRMAIAGQY